jgi:Protein of unknown function, DUF547
MLKVIIALLFSLLWYVPSHLQTKPAAMPVPDLVKLSQEFLYAARTGDTVMALLADTLARSPEEELSRQLVNDAQKMAFWINLYNAFTQMALQQQPERYRKRNKFFTAKNFRVAGKSLSLDDMEHGILRHSKIKWSLGYLGKWWPSAFEQKHRVKALDHRLHFALNCGAKSCPPIAYYEPGKLDEQLTMATKNYLRTSVIYDDATNTLTLPAILSWFRADFGGKKGILRLIKDQRLLPEERRPRIKISKYDWTLALGGS